MLNIMYEIPSSHDVKKCLIEERTVRERIDPTLIRLTVLRTQNAASASGPTN